mmetsp:Transcript_22766/g.52680  ORF Transcript_22766/g.52680 Transcript_22766/m.52680 type:complete len:285 (+) Transcript_22766:919-1773(+)
MPLVRRSLGQDQLLAAAGADSLHAQPQHPSEGLRALLHDGLLSCSCHLPFGQHNTAPSLDLHDARQVNLLLLITTPSEVLLRVGRLLRARLSSEDGEALLHFGHHLDPRVEDMVHSHPGIIEPALLRVAIVEEFFPILGEKLHPVRQIFSDVFLLFGDLILNLPEATHLDYSSLVVHDLPEEVVHGMLPGRLSGRCVVEVDAPLLVLMFGPPRRKRGVEGLFSNPEHVCFPDWVDVQALDVLEHLHDARLLSLWHVRGHSGRGCRSHAAATSGEAGGGGGTLRH